MRKKVQINLVSGYLSDFTVKKTVLCLNSKSKFLKENENILILNSNETKSINTYNIKLIKCKQGVCYIASDFNVNLELEIVNKTQMNGELKISGLSLYNLKTTGFKKVILEDSKISCFTYDAKKVELDMETKVKKMIYNI